MSHPYANFQQPPGGPTPPAGQHGGPPMGADYYTKLNPEMLNLGLAAGQDIINRQTAKWMPGVSDFWVSLKFYFAVRNKLKKSI